MQQLKKKKVGFLILKPSLDINGFYIRQHVRQCVQQLVCCSRYLAKLQYEADLAEEGPIIKIMGWCRMPCFSDEDGTHFLIILLWH